MGITRCSKPWVVIKGGLVPARHLVVIRCGSLISSAVRRPRGVRIQMRMDNLRRISMKIRESNLKETFMAAI